MTPEQYCQQKTVESGSSFYYSFLFLPVDQRQAMLALYAFCREVDDVVDECSDKDIAQNKLDWWRQEVVRMFEGRPQHPVGQALQTPLQNYHLSIDHFNTIIDGMEMDLNDTDYEDFKSLTHYCYRVASTVGLLSIEIFGYMEAQTRQYAYDLGIALQLTNILRDVREDALRGRIYLPLEELDQFEVTPQMLLEKQTPDNVEALFAFQFRRAQQYYEQARGHLPMCDRFNQRCGLVMAAIYQATLDEIEKDGFKVLEHRISLTPLRKLWIAWRTASTEKWQHKKAGCKYMKAKHDDS